MSNGLNIFIEEFKEYVLSKLPVVSLNFGNMSYDYSLECIGGKYFLTIYDVALDHYGMPYRNMLVSELVDISFLLE